MATYNYTVTASGNSYYLWNGHGLVDAQNPDLFFRAGDSVTITNASGGHPMRITNNAAPSVGVIDESGGQIVRDPVTEGTFTYFCTSHPSAMMGAITVSAAYANEGPEDGYGTGPLIGHDAGPLSMNEIRTKINEIITKGGVGTSTTPGGGSISVSQNAPGSPSDGDLWWDLDTASLYVYLEDRDAWIQTNGAVGGGVNFSTGWVQTDGTTTVANGAKMQFDHNLGSSDIIVEVWVADDIDGTNNNRLSYQNHDTGATIRYGAAVHGATNNTIGVVLGSSGYIDEQGDLSQAPTGVHQFTGKYIKVIASAGGGGGGGGGGTPAGSDRQLQFNDNGTFGANANLKLDGSGNLFVPRLIVGEGNFAGDEGGEVALRQSETNNTLVGNWIYMDTFRNLIRFFEDGPPYKGAYIDLTECADGVGTNLLAGGGGNASIKVQPTAPLSPSDGDLWFNSTQAELYVYVDAESAWIQTNGGGGSGGGNFSTGWVQTDGTETLAASKTLTFDHNLGTTDLTTQIWVADNASGDNAFQVINAAATSYGSNAPWNVGASITNITTTSLSVTIAEDSVAKWSSSGNLQEVDVAPSTGKYIKVVASAGGSGAGPRAYVSFNPTAGATSTSASANITPDIYNQFNISSITDRGYFVYNGNQTGYRWTINLSNPVVNPVVHVSADNTATVGSYGLVPGSTTERYADIHANYHIEDNNTIHVFIVNASGTGLPQDSYTHMSVTIF